MACEVWFYHLERSSLEQVLPELLERTLARGWRALVRSPDAGRIARLDGWLWAFSPERFLPHGRADEPMAERQPVLLTTDAQNLNGARALFLLDGAEPGPLEGLERCLVVFDGTDEASVTNARADWKTLKAAGHPVSYWKDTAQGWKKQGG